MAAAEDQAYYTADEVERMMASAETLGRQKERREIVRQLRAEATTEVQAQRVAWLERLAGRLEGAR